MHEGYFFLAVSKLSLQCLHILGKKEITLENREETLNKNSQGRFHTTNNFITKSQNIWTFIIISLP